MRNFHKPMIWGVLCLAFLAASPRLRASGHENATPMKGKTEADFIQDLAPTNEAGKIVDAIGGLEKLHGADASCTNSIRALKSLLADSREPVRRKAARVLGVFHAPMDAADIQLVCAQLRASDWREVQSGLKALRDLNCSAAVPDILPCLKHINPYVVRDACRTLAVVATKAVVPGIEPLVNSPDPKVREDAQNAIAILNARP